MTTSDNNVSDISAHGGGDDVKGIAGQMSIGFKLNGPTIYTTWMFAMTTLLTAFGLQDYIDSTKSETATDPSKKARIMLAITRNIGMAQLSLIKSFANNPAGAWAALSAEYAGKTNQDMATLLIELFGKRLQENATVAEAKSHFESMIDLNIRLREIDASRALPDLIVAVLMAMSLPNDMEQVRYRRLSGPAKGRRPSYATMSSHCCVDSLPPVPPTATWTERP
jgi:hypothetical protein